MPGLRPQAAPAPAIFFYSHIANRVETNKLTTIGWRCHWGSLLGTVVGSSGDPRHVPTVSRIMRFYEYPKGLLLFLSVLFCILIICFSILLASYKLPWMKLCFGKVAYKFDGWMVMMMIIASPSRNQTPVTTHTQTPGIKHLWDKWRSKPQPQAKQQLPPTGRPTLIPQQSPRNVTRPNDKPGKLQEGGHPTYGACLSDRELLQLALHFGELLMAHRGDPGRRGVSCPSKSQKGGIPY